MRWAIVPGQSLRHGGWQDEYVVYNDLSGDTHLMSAAAWELLVALEGRAASVAELATRLDLADDTHADLAALLGSLQALGLVEQ